MDLKAYLRLTFYRIRYKFQELKLRLSAYMGELDKKGRERLTIMIIPHTEKKSLNLHISYKAITIFIACVILLMVISAISVLNHSGTVHEISELHLSNKDFIRQSAKMKSELSSLHEIIDYYYKKISNLYIKLGGDPAKVSKGIGGNDKLNPANKQTDINSETYKLKSDVHNLKVSSELTQEIIKMIKKRKSVIKHTPSLWPTRGYILNPFGVYLSPSTGREVNNSGIDIGSFSGAEVVVTAPGVVYEVSHSDKTGYIIKIAHKYGWKTIYSNLDRVQVKKGQQVSKSDVIGFVGRSSNNSLYFLHYEVHVGTQPLNPYSFLNQIQEK